MLASGNLAKHLKTQRNINFYLQVPDTYIQTNYKELANQRRAAKDTLGSYFVEVSNALFV
jgi:transcription initiation factor TFIIIB Brf1 subunit/transcription initiation factor TFIIB